MIKDKKRICIIGGPGSGKSTLANILNQKLSLPKYHLDGFHFNQNWVENDKQQRDLEVIRIANTDEWIIEGVYSSTLLERIKLADLVIYLDYSQFALIRNVILRRIKTKSRPEIHGAKERITFDFLNYVIHYKKVRTPIIEEIITEANPTYIIRFKKRKTLNQWIKSI